MHQLHSQFHLLTVEFHYCHLLNLLQLIQRKRQPSCKLFHVLEHERSSFGLYQDPLQLSIQKLIFRHLTTEIWYYDLVCIFSSSSRLILLDSMSNTKLVALKGYTCEKRTGCLI